MKEAVEGRGEGDDKPKSSLKRLSDERSIRSVSLATFGSGVPSLRVGEGLRPVGEGEAEEEEGEGGGEEGAALPAGAAAASAEASRCL